MHKPPQDTVVCHRIPPVVCLFPDARSCNVTVTILGVGLKPVMLDVELLGAVEGVVVNEAVAILDKLA